MWGGDELTKFGKTFWEVPLDKGRLMLERAVMNHFITSRLAVPLMLESGGGLIVERTDFFSYRGNVLYDLLKTSVIRLAFAMAWELRRSTLTALAVTPGLLRSEAMLDRFGVTDANWRDAVGTEGQCDEPRSRKPKKKSALPELDPSTCPFGTPNRREGNLRVSPETVQGGRK